MKFQKLTLKSTRFSFDLHGCYCESKLSPITKESNLNQHAQRTSSQYSHTAWHTLSSAITMQHFFLVSATRYFPSILISLHFRLPLFLTFILNIIELFQYYFIIFLLMLNYIAVHPRLQQVLMFIAWNSCISFGCAFDVRNLTWMLIIF